MKRPHTNVPSVGYVEFEQVESVAHAIELTGQNLAGIPVIIRPGADHVEPSDDHEIDIHPSYLAQLERLTSSVDIKGLQKVSSSYFVSTPGFPDDELVGGLSTDRSGMSATQATIPENPENSSRPSIYIHYTLSEDRTGDRDNVMAAHLAALGHQHSDTGIKKASLSLLRG